MHFFSEETGLENIVCEMVIILSRLKRNKNKINSLQCCHMSVTAEIIKENIKARVIGYLHGEST